MATTEATAATGQWWRVTAECGSDQVPSWEMNVLLDVIQVRS